MRRGEELISLIMPLLNPETKREMIESGKSCYVILKEKPPNDEYLLESHLETILLDFDQNIHYLDKSEIQAFSEILNKEPMKSFFLGDD